MTFMRGDVMGGGGSSSGYRPPVQAQLQPVPTADIQAAQGPQYGPTVTPNPYAADNVPPWAQGWFSMPWWGMDPFGSPMSREQTMYQQPAPPVQQAPEAAPQAPQTDPAQVAYNLGYAPRGDTGAYNRMQDPYERYLYQQGRQTFDSELNRRRELATFGVGGRDGGG